MPCEDYENDLQDIHASLQGEGAAYARLVRRYESAIALQMSHYTRNQDEQRELLQQVFIEAYRSLPRYRPEAPFIHWLRRIASRVGYRYWKIQNRERRRTVPMEEWHERTMAVAPEQQQPSEATEHLFLLLEQLPTRERVVLTMMYFEDYDVRTIAGHLGWTQSLVKVCAFRARKRLKKMLEEAGYGR